MYLFVSNVFFSFFHGLLNYRYPISLILINKFLNFKIILLTPNSPTKLSATESSVPTYILLAKGFTIILTKGFTTYYDTHLSF
jgi:hypothetical protein